MTNDEILEIMEVIQSYGDDSMRYIPNTTLRTGATKNCLVFKQEDFVVKFPKRGNRFDKITECQMEVDLYQDAEKFRVQPVLLPTFYLGKNSADIPFYIQKKIDYSVWETPRDSSIKYVKMTQAINNDILSKVQSSFLSYSSINITWLKMVWLIYGEKFMRSLEDWMNQNQINDLHESNLGYRNHKPVLLDFSGFGRQP